MPDSWSLAEVEATVADYFAMLTRELKREPVNKRDHRRALQRVLDSRSEGAIEFKHANISAVLIAVGYPYIEGYKPRSNYQRLLRDAVVDRIELDAVFRALVARRVAEEPLQLPGVSTWNDVHVPPPRREAGRRRVVRRAGAASTSRRPRGSS